MRQWAGLGFGPFAPRERKSRAAASRRRVDAVTRSTGTVLGLLALFVGLVFAQLRPEADARLVVKTVPQAAIFLDGKPVGSASGDGQFVTTVPLFEPRQYQLRVTLPGRLSFEQRLTLTPGRDTTIDAPLQAPQPVGRLELFSTPQAEVLVNGKLAGKADAQGRIELRGLEAGPLRLEIRRPGYLAAIRTVTVDATTPTTVNLELEEVAHPSVSAQRPPDFSPTRNLVGHSGTVRAIAFSPDSRWLVSAAEDDTVRLWEIATGRQRRMWSFGSYVSRVQFSPDGRLLAVAPGSGGAVHIVDSMSGETTRTLSPVWWNLNDSLFPYFAFSSDSRQIAIAGNEKDLPGWIADVATGELTLKLDACCSLLAMPKGGWVVMPVGIEFGGEDIPIRLFDSVARPTGTIALRDRAEYEAAALTADGRWLASVSWDKDHVQIWDTMTGREGYRLDPDESDEWFHRLVFSPDGRWLVTRSGKLIANDRSLPYDRQFRSFVKVWDTGTGRVVRQYAPQSYAVSLDYSPDGDWLALGLHEGSIALWGRTP